MFYCGTCWKQFPSGCRARDQHCDSTGHRVPKFECDTCSAHFGSEQSRHQHMKDRNHFAWECRRCDETWPSDQARKNHEVSEHYYCFDCDRVFQNHNNIKMASPPAKAHDLPIGC